MARFRRTWMAAALAAITAAATAVWLGADQQANLSHSWDFSAATESREIEVEVSDSARVVSVSAEVHVAEGRVRYLLLDPSGAERLVGTAEPGDAKWAKWESGELPAVTGMWRARFELTEASGRLRVRSRVR